MHMLPDLTYLGYELRAPYVGDAKAIAQDFDVLMYAQVPGVEADLSWTFSWNPADVTTLRS